IFTWRSVVIGNFRNFFSTNRDSDFSSPRFDHFHRADDNGYGNEALIRGNNSEQENLFSSRISSKGIIRIKRIIVEGVAYASECTHCEPGTYAPQSSMHECLPCPPNTAYSGYGATECTNCDPVLEYSPRGSVSCRKRPVCGPN